MALPLQDFPRPGEDVAVRRQKGEQAGERSETERARMLRGFPPKTKNPGRVTRPNAPGKEDLPPVSRQKVLKQTLNLCWAGLWLPVTVHDAVSRSLHLPAHQSLKRWKSPPVHCLFNRRSGVCQPSQKASLFFGHTAPQAHLLGELALSGENASSPGYVYYFYQIYWQNSAAEAYLSIAGTGTS